jgi:DNA polymerase III subunit delta'
MTVFNWPHCIGQRRVKEVLESAVAGGSLGHAYLFSGAGGCGKFAAALDLAFILLCENDAGRPCMKCPSCTRVLHYAHPDFRVIMPVVLSKEKKQKNDDGITETGFKEISERISERIVDPYLAPQHEKVPEIPVELVRDLSHTILRGAHGKGPNVAVFDGIDSLNKESANSMLKLLEEPPAGTVLLLLTERPNAVLPTIVSRCQILRFSWCRPDEIRAELCRRFSVQPTDPKLDAVINTGSLGRSLFLWNNPADEVRKEADALWDLSLRKDWTGLGSAVDRLQEQGDFSMYEQLFLEFMQRARTTFLRELGGTENVFSSDRTGTGGNLTRAAAEQLLDLCERSIAAVKARANMMLVLAHFAITLTETLHGEKQQPR